MFLKFELENNKLSRKSCPRTYKTTFVALIVKDLLYNTKEYKVTAQLRTNKQQKLMRVYRNGARLISHQIRRVDHQNTELTLNTGEQTLKHFKSPVKASALTRSSF